MKSNFLVFLIFIGFVASRILLYDSFQTLKSSVWKVYLPKPDSSVAVENSSVVLTNGGAISTNGRWNPASGCKISISGTWKTKEGADGMVLVTRSKFPSISERLSGISFSVMPQFGVMQIIVLSGTDINQAPIDIQKDFNFTILDYGDTVSLSVTSGDGLFTMSVPTENVTTNPENHISIFNRMSNNVSKYSSAIENILIETPESVMWIIDPIVYTRNDSTKVYVKENVISFASSFPPIVSIDWGDGFIESPRIVGLMRGYWQNEPVSHSYNQSGTYNVTLKLGDRCSFTDVRLFILDVLDETKTTTGIQEITTGYMTTGREIISHEKPKLSGVVGVVIGVGAFATIGAIFVLVIAYLWVSKKKKQLHKKTIEKQEANVNNPLHQVNSEFSLSQVTINEKIGSGRFGEVYIGSWQNHAIAAKKMTIKDESFIRELEMSFKLRHPNIVQTFGTFKSQEGDLYVIMEYMNRGSLLSFLREKKLNDLWKYLHICWQACKALVYLESLKIIHRDISARNFVVSTNGEEITVKLCDFGMSKKLKEETYVGCSLFPVRWCSPEVLKFATFSVKSDVWSFGIVLWEIFSDGTGPYNDIAENEKVMMAVLNGYRLPKPERSPDDIYEMMKNCWKEEPNERPSFEELFTILSKEQPGENTKPEILRHSSEAKNESYCLMPAQMLQAELQETSSESSVQNKEEIK